MAQHHTCYQGWTIKYLTSSRSLIDIAFVLIDPLTIWIQTSIDNIHAFTQTERVSTSFCRATLGLIINIPIGILKFTINALLFSIFRRRVVNNVYVASNNKAVVIREVVHVRSCGLYLKKSTLNVLHKLL